MLSVLQVSDPILRDLSLLCTPGLIRYGAETIDPGLCPRFSHKSMMSGPAAGCGREATFGSGDVVSGSLSPTARVLWMCQLCQRCTVDHTMLLQRLVALSEEHEEDAQAWQAEDVTHEDAQDWCEETQNWHEEERDWADREFRA
ncbi:hypothetical protein Y1Q_0010826 [Alligator mississippiensis]|uniref:Uncharacterized protein n=1 Tax=Alligator mississippiensis TaxID=8496 RepID=A0A151M710_ALLMI|nr:hypothetical protein Y1Q_0010826 [Alligator mississippiensis]